MFMWNINKGFLTNIEFFVVVYSEISSCNKKMISLVTCDYEKSWNQELRFLFFFLFFFDAKIFKKRLLEFMQNPAIFFWLPHFMLFLCVKNYFNFFFLLLLFFCFIMLSIEIKKKCFCFLYFNICPLKYHMYFILKCVIWYFILMLFILYDITIFIKMKYFYNHEIFLVLLSHNKRFFAVRLSA